MSEFRESIRRGAIRLCALISLGVLCACAGTPPATRISTSQTTGIPLTAEATLTAAVSAPSPTPAATRAPVTPLPTDSVEAIFDPYRLYTSQPGDTWISVSNRLGVLPPNLQCASPCPFDPGELPNALLPTGTKILTQFPYKQAGEPGRLVPDSEVVFSAAAVKFDVNAYAQATDGFLNKHRQYLMMNAWNTGADIVALVAEENSINPRLLLALLEYQCACVLEDAVNPAPFMQADFHNRQDLYGQLVWAIHELSNGYYGWRAGTLKNVVLRDGTSVALSPDLNAGTVALYQMFSKLLGSEQFFQALDPDTGFPATFRQMFGNPWLRELQVYPDGTAQPDLVLPFDIGTTWSYTGGPHPAFESNGPLASLDFAPASAAPGCQPTSAWVLAAADGLVVRSEFGLVIQDLDGDGLEQTGWVIMYLHIGESDRVPVGTKLKAGDRIGQPSCEGGTTNGTHVHIARKLNGEWIAAGSGPLPFNLGGWVAQDGPLPYKGTLHRGDVTLEACTCSWRQSWIERDE